jgi:actin-related protein 8
MSSDLNDDTVDNNFKWANTSNKPKVLIGREALTIQEEQNYIIHKPIKYGYFNSDYQNQSVVDDVTKIIEYCLVQILQINKKTFANFQIVLLIPDLFVKVQVKSLVNVFLKSFGFKAIFLHLESVMSSFGAALQSACVLDIGSDKISVCCVDEGIIMEETLIRKNFGCDDLTKFFYLMLKRKNAKNYFPFEQINLNKKNCNQVYHYRIIEKLKEAECEFPNLLNPTSQFIPKNCKIWLHKKNFPTKMFNVTLSEAAYLTPLVMLNTDLLAEIRNVKIPAIGFFNDIYGEMYADPEDTYEELIMNLNAENAGGNKKEEGAGNFNGNASANKVKKGRSGNANNNSSNNFYNNNNNYDNNLDEDEEDDADKYRNEDKEMLGELSSKLNFLSF